MVALADLIRTDIHAYLQAREQQDLLRFITCGSVDDGKSTLIGRLLYDSGNVFQDHLEALRKSPAPQAQGSPGENGQGQALAAGGEIDLAFLVDGLQSEREQGITIDVAHRYFATARRKFIIADCPGHVQYTRNMATGASTANLAIILIDARKGVLSQTRRHSFIVSLVGIRHAVIAVNKMDLVDHDPEVFERIAADYRAFAAGLGFSDLTLVPVSAKHGDNVVRRSAHMPWYKGPSILELLETVEVTDDVQLQALRFPVQYVNRPHLDFRGFAGTIVTGQVRRGDPVMVLPSKRTSRVKSIVTAAGELAEASAPEPVTLTLEDEVDVSRGDMLVHPDEPATLGPLMDARILWMAEMPLVPGKPYVFRTGTKYVRGTVVRIDREIDVNTQEEHPAEMLPMNHIGLCRVHLNEPVAFDPYESSPRTGSFILVDAITNGTVGAGMIVRGVEVDAPDVLPEVTTGRITNVVWHAHKVSQAERAGLKGQRPCIVWLTGLSGSGKSTLANALEQALWTRGHHTYLLDGDNVRHGLNKDLDFSDAGRIENIRRIGEVAKLMVDAGLIVITAFISPFKSERALVRSLVNEGEFLEVYVDASLAVCEARDPKGLFRRARAGEIRQFTGIDSPYEPPDVPELRIRTGEQSVEESLRALLDLLGARGILRGEK